MGATTERRGRGWETEEVSGGGCKGGEELAGGATTIGRGIG